MGLTREKIEHFLGDKYAEAPAGTRKWMKNQLNRWIRRHPDKLGGVFKRCYKGWEY